MKYPEPTFVRSTAPYIAYTDFWKLVEVAGFHSVPAATVDLDKAGLLIWPTMDMEFIDRLSRHPKGIRAAKVIFWNIERPDEKPGVDALELYRRGMGEILEWADEIWVSDMTLHAADRRTIFAILGGHHRLREMPALPRAYDVAHLGILTPRRVELLERLKARGIRVSGNAWGSDRAHILASSKLLLNIDRIEGLNLYASLRCVLAAAYHLPVVHEEVREPYPLTSGVSLLTAPYARLEDLVLRTLERSDLRGVAAEAWETLCLRWTFIRGVEDALRRSPCLLT